MAATALLETLNPTTQTEPGEILNEDLLYEEVDGQRIERRPMSYYAGTIATRLAGRVIIHLDQQSPVSGEIVVEVIFRLPLPEGSRNRRPDLAFVSFDRWPIDRPKSSRDNAWDVVPDLAVEVTSPTDSGQDQLQKVSEYFQAGVRLVWVVYPKMRCIHVYEAWNRIRVVTEADTLDGGVVLPGFQLPLNRLFGPVEPVTDSE